MGRQAREKRARRAVPSGPAPLAAPLGQRVAAWMWGPQPVARLAALRILLPLAILGFLSSRLVHADHWIGAAGFHVPDLGRDDYRQPLFIPALPNAVAWTIATVTTAAGLALALGAFTRASNIVFAGLLIFLALADRLSAFTVSKLGAGLMVALAFTPAGQRVSVDAWWRRRRAREGAMVAPSVVSGGNVRFFQLTLAVMYCATGVAKLRGDWLVRHDVIYTNLHDSYQTAFSYLLASRIPGWGWAGFQGLVLALEVGAPLWLALPATRYPAVILLLGMHAVIGLGFGPVIWFASLMASLLVACFAPRAWLERSMGLEGRGREAGK